MIFALSVFAWVFGPIALLVLVVAHSERARVWLEQLADLVERS